MVLMIYILHAFCWRLFTAWAVRLLTFQKRWNLSSLFDGYDLSPGIGTGIIGSHPFPYQESSASKDSKFRMGHSDVIWQMNPDLLGDGKVSAQKQVFLSFFALRDIEINQSMTIIPLKAKHMVQECRIGAGLGVFPPAEVCSVSLATKTEGPGRRSVCIIPNRGCYSCSIRLY